MKFYLNLWLCPCKCMRQRLCVSKCIPWVRANTWLSPQAISTTRFDCRSSTSRGLRAVYSADPHPKIAPQPQAYNCYNRTFTCYISLTSRIWAIKAVLIDKLCSRIWYSFQELINVHKVEFISPWSSLSMHQIQIIFLFVTMTWFLMLYRSS
jgi:hypothetical protein